MQILLEFLIFSIILIGGIIIASLFIDFLETYFPNQATIIMIIILIFLLVKAFAMIKGISIASLLLLE